MNSIRSISASVLGAFTLISAAAYGQAVTYTFEGDGHNFAGNLPFNFDARTISSVGGIPGTVAATFDLTGATDLAPVDAGMGVYTLSNASLTVNIGFSGGAESYTYTGDLQLYIYNDYTNPNGFSGVADGVLILANGGIVNGNPGSSFDLQFYTLNTSAWGSDAAANVSQLQSAFGSVAGLAQQFRLYSGEPGESQGISFNAYSTGVAIPEPSTYAALAGVAVLGLAGIRRRRSRR